MDSSRTSLLDDDYDTYPAHTRLPNEQVLEIYAELTLQGAYHLLPYEEAWKARRPFLESKGYELRPRYSEDWWPSWIGTDINPFFCEDSIDSCLPHIMDATLWEGDEPIPVIIKATPSWTKESNIACMFSFEEKVDDPRNHCVPVMDVFASPTEAQLLFLVMPLLRAFNDPPFAAVEEVVDFIDQILQGIEFMHLNGVAHRDITRGNIMMDGSGMYPEGFHPVRQHLDPSAKIEVVPMMRTMTKPKYYIIDFDGSLWFPPDMPAKFRTATGKHGADDEVPEMSEIGPYDPFKVDIFQFGNVLKREFLDKYVGLEFLESMVRDMTRPNPPDRPSVGSIIARFTRLRSNLRPNQLKRALSPKASSDPLRDHLRSLGIFRDPLEHDPGLDEVEEEEYSDDPTLGLRTTSSGDTHDSAGSAAGEDYWDSEATRRSVSTAATSLTTSPTTTSPPPVPGIGSVFSQWLPGRPKSPVALRKGPPTPIIVSPNPMSPTSPPDLLGGRRGPLPFFARSLSPDSVPPSPSSPTSPINIHHHRKGSGGGPSGTLAFLKTGKFPWTVSESPSSRASTPDIEKFKLESDFIAYTAANGGPGNNSASPTSPSNSWSKAMSGLHGFMGGKKRGRERSNSKLSIGSETGPWGSAGGTASSSAVDMANWGSNPEDAVSPSPSNQTPPPGGLAAFWGLGKSSSSPPVKKERKCKSMSVAPAPNATGWDIPKPEASSSTSTPPWPANGAHVEFAKESKPSSKSSTAKPTPASSPPSATPAPITKLSKKPNKRAAQAAAAASAPVPTPITEKDLPPKATEEEEWTPGPSSTSPPSKGISSFWSAGKEEKKKKKAGKAETQAPAPAMSAAATQASLVAAMADTWNEESEEPARDMSHWAGAEHGFGIPPGPTLTSAFNATAWGPPFAGPEFERESPRTAASPISFSHLGSASSSSKATPGSSGKSTPAPTMPAGKAADKRTPVSNQAPAKPLALDENPDASDWMAFTNKTKNAGLRPSKLGSSVISAEPNEKPTAPGAGKTGATSGWGVKQGPPKQESSAWGAFGASPTDAAFQARTKAKAPEPMRKSAQAGAGPGPQFGGWGSINTPVQPPIENNWETWSVRSVPAIEIVSPPTASPSAKEELPSIASPPMSTWSPLGSAAGGSSNRTSTVTTMDMPPIAQTARSSWTSLVKEPHGFGAAQWKFNGSGSTLGPVSEGARESGAGNDVWEMDIGGSGPASDASVAWPGEISPELLRSLQGPPEYSSGSDMESKKRKSEIGSGLRRPESGFKSAFANLSDSGEEKGKRSLVPNKSPLNNVSDSSSSRSSWSTFPKKATSSPPGFGLSKSPPSAPAVIASTAKGKTAAVRPTARMPGGFMSWDEEDGEPKDVNFDQLISMVDGSRNSAEPAPNFLRKNQTAAQPRAPVVPTPAPTQAAKGKKGKRGKAMAVNGFDEEGPDSAAPTAPVLSAIDDGLLAQLDSSLQPQARPQVNPPPSPYKTRTKTVWIEDEVPTHTGSLEVSSFPNPLENQEKREKPKKPEEEEKEEETTKAGAGAGAGTGTGGANKKTNNNNNKKAKKKR